MKKIALLISIAAATSLMATEVEVYGVAHVSGDSVDNGQNSTVVFASNSSRLGVKGSTEITDSLTALGQFEVGVDLTGVGRDDGNGGDYNNNAALFTSARDSFIGLKGDFGMVLAGNLPAINQWLYDYNLFADQVGDLGNIWGAASSIGIDRASNTVAYFIPSVVPGLSGDIAYVSDASDAVGAVTNDGNSVTAVLVKANYENSGFKIGVGYVALNNDYLTAGQDDPAELAITASYTMDNFSIGGGYLNSQNKGNNPNRDIDSYTIGASYTIDKTTLKAQWAAANDDNANSDANMIAVGVDYAIAKNATVYVAYAATNNDANAAYNANNWGHGKSAYGAPAAGNDPKAFSIGLVYKFGAKVYNK